MGVSFPGEPAFPVEGHRDLNYFGLSKFEWFAGMALQGILAGGFADTVPHSEAADEAAKFACDYAHAIMATLNKSA